MASPISACFDFGNKFNQRRLKEGKSEKEDRLPTLSEGFNSLLNQYNHQKQERIFYYNKPCKFDLYVLGSVFVISDIVQIRHDQDVWHYPYACLSASSDRMPGRLTHL